MFRKVFFFILITQISFGQLRESYDYDVRDMLENPITQEYFLKPLLEEHKKEYPFTKKEITKEIIQNALEIAYRYCPTCFGGYALVDPGDEDRYPLIFKEKNFNINFKDYISVGGFIPQYYSLFISKEYDDFKKFRKTESSRLKYSGIKKKADQENVHNKLIELSDSLGKKLAQFYMERNYKNEFYKKFGKKYAELNMSGSGKNDKLKKHKLLKEKISPHFNSLDNIIINPKNTSKVNSEEENVELKKMLLDKGLVKIEEWNEPDDGYTFIFPKISDELEERLGTLNYYFQLDEDWSEAKSRILKLWYGNLSNEFALQNFLQVCGNHVPSKEDFLVDENKLKNLIEGYVDKLIGGWRVGGTFKNMDKKLKMYPKQILFHNIVNNHYKIQSDDLKKIREQRLVVKEKEYSKKGGFLRDKTFYKINSRNQFDKLDFGYALGVDRKINQSWYYGEYERKSGNIYKLTQLTDLKTGIQLPEFEARLSSDKTKLYLGEDKIPYILNGSNGTNCLKDKNTTWYSSDNKESFSTSYGESKWKSSISGGIQVNGFLYKISNNKYAFIINRNSWGGKIENNLIIITTENNCNTIYYGIGKKKMAVK